MSGAEKANASSNDQKSDWINDLLDSGISRFDALSSNSAPKRLLFAPILPSFWRLLLLVVKCKWHPCSDILLALLSDFFSPLFSSFLFYFFFFLSFFSFSFFFSILPPNICLACIFIELVKSCDHQARSRTRTNIQFS